MCVLTHNLLNVTRMLLQHFTILILILMLSRTKAAGSHRLVQSLPGCSDKCGNITIPYPFGIQENCYLEKRYQVNCTTLTLYNNTAFKLLDISVDGFMHGVLPMAYGCYNITHKLSGSDLLMSMGKFAVSSAMNLLTTVGCDTRADIMTVVGERNMIASTTMSECNNLYDGACFGHGCSQVQVPSGMSRALIRSQRNTGKVGNWSFNNCSYAFIVQRDQYTFHKTDFDSMLNRSLPVVFEWTVGHYDCKHAQKDKRSYMCKQNSVCIDSSSGNDGYNCRCVPGYEGNPYLPNGCQDINECEEGALNDCIYHCVNTYGSYNCSCPFGKSGAGREHGSGCYDLEAAKSLGKTLYICIIVGLIASVSLTLILYAGLKQRRIMKSREMFFKKNGGLILQKILFESKLSSHLVKIFTARVLEKATNNFHKTNVIGQGGYGTVYKGMLENKTMVAIKRAKSIDNNQIEQFINEVIILSEINHPNVVKLMGCCLESQTPLLVYEFVTNKTVFHHEKDYASSMTFERRLNIATQTAEAIAHIHSTTQIIHRDIKSSNILLTDDYTAKVSDFGISRFIPVDETHVQTLVHGTLGYIDPEYFRSGILTEKSDVYSFGMVLVELLTGRKVFSYNGTESDLGLAMFFVSSLERDCLTQILDDHVKKDGINEHIKCMAKLAKDCIQLEGKKRPNMKDVKEQQSIIKIKISFGKP